MVSLGVQGPPMIIGGPPIISTPPKLKMEYQSPHHRALPILGKYKLPPRPIPSPMQLTKDVYLIIVVF